MSPDTFNYRNQLISIFFDIDHTIANLFHMGFNIGLEEEWQDLKGSIQEGDPIPADLEYLKAINHVTLPGIIEMIEILVEARNSLSNINQLRDEELLPPELITEEFTESDEQENRRSHYLDVWIEALFADLLTLFESLWELAHQTQLPDEMYDLFGQMYFEGGLAIESDDHNVCFLLEALNKVLKVNGRTEFYG